MKGLLVIEPTTYPGSPVRPSVKYVGPSYSYKKTMAPARPVNHQAKNSGPGLAHYICVETSPMQDEQGWDQAIPASPKETMGLGVHGLMMDLGSPSWPKILNSSSPKFRN